MSKQIEALKMAIELINQYEQGWESDEAIATINACKEALAEAEKHEWQSLSDDEIFELSIREFTKYEFARAIEQALKEKNKC